MSEQQQDSFFQATDPGSIWTNQAQEAVGTPAAPEGQPPIEQAPAQPQTAPVDPQGQTTEGDGQPALEPREIPDHMSPEHVYAMATYQQSRADKVLAEKRELEAKIEALNSANPIGQYAVNDPAFMAHVSQYFASTSNGQPSSNQALAGGNVAPAPLQKPEPPQRPATMEPYSEEAERYQQAQAQYLLELGEYNSNLMQSQVTQLQQAQLAQQEAQRQAAAQQQLQQELMYQHGLNQQDAQGFMQFAQDPKNQNDLGLWITAYKLRNGQQVQPTPSPATPAANLMRGQQQPPPQTAAAVPGASGAQPVEDSFFVSKKARSIW